jgi:hypothetical protein
VPEAKRVDRQDLACVMGNTGGKSEVSPCATSIDHEPARVVTKKRARDLLEGTAPVVGEEHMRRRSKRLAVDTAVVISETVTSVVGDVVMDVVDDVDAESDDAELRSKLLEGPLSWSKLIAGPLYSGGDADDCYSAYDERGDREMPCDRPEIMKDILPVDSAMSRLSSN